jgi:hypothetical protein
MSRPPFPSLHVTGGLLAADLFSRVLDDKDLAGRDPADYGLPPHESVREAASRAFDYLGSTWQAFARDRDRAIAEGRPMAGLTRDRWLLSLFRELAYGMLQTTPAGGIVVEDRSFKVSHLYGHVPVHLLGWGTDLDHRTKGVAGAADAAPQSMVQELLNRTDAHLWAILSNGRQLRLLRDSRSLAGSAYVEFDLELIFEEQLFSDFVLLYRLLHASRLTVGPDEPPAACWLERWRTAAIEQGERALAGLRDGVRRAIDTLGTGFLRHPANDALRERLSGGTLSGDDYKRTVLRVVYRLLFWFVAEDREVLLDPGAAAGARATYGRYFSSQRLRERARRGGTDHHDDLWQASGIVFAGLGSEAGRPELGLPGIGGLFERIDHDEHGRPLTTSAPDALDEPLEGLRLANQDLLAAVRDLSVTGSVGRRPVDFRHLGSEELGSVYESLLELHPSYDPHERQFTLIEAAGNERKKTGSYYTPSSLTELLLDSALDPVLTAAAGTPGDTEAKVAALLAVTVCDPACGSGHFLVAAARRIARRIAQLRSGEDEPVPDRVREAMREVVGRCISGVDVNEMAAELAKVSLWLESVEPGRPLPFLDANIRVGNSLLGTTPALIDAGIPRAAFKPLPGDDRKISAALAKRNQDEEQGQYDLFSEGIAVSTEAIAKHTAELVRALPARLADVHVQRRRLREIDAERARAKRLADAWCAAFVQEKTAATEPFAITRATLDWIADPPANLTQIATVERVDGLARDYRFFHWHVEFPHIFAAPDGTADADSDTGWHDGFACVIGNPPWERVKLQEQEFFASRDTAIAKAKNAAERKRLIADLPGGSALRQAFDLAQRTSTGTTHLLRTTGRYPLTGTGDVNTYSVFAETMRSLLLRTGRMGVLTPTGLATDATTAAFFRDTLRTGRLAVFYDFDNEAKIFPGVHHALRFALTAITGGQRVADVGMAFVVRHVIDLPERRFTLAPEEILLLNPNTGTLPVFRTRADAEITLGIYRRHPVLIRDNSPDGNPWGLSFATMFHMANDSDLFLDGDDFEGSEASFDGWAWAAGKRRWLPLYEAKLLGHYDHRFSTYAGATEAELRMNTLPRLAAEAHNDPYTEPLARYWVAESEVAEALVDARDPQHRPRWDRDWFLGWRNIARASDARTFVPCIFPRTAVNHAFPIVLSARGDAGASLYVVWSSLVFDYIARQKLSGTNMTYTIVEQLACPVPAIFEEPAGWAPGRTLAEFVVPRVLELSYTSYRIAGYARDLGDDGPPFRWDPARREQMRAELDGAMFHVYGLTRAETEHVLDSFFVVRKYEMRDHGEFRTRRLVLERYDAMSEAIRTGVPYRTPLDPPPGHGPRHPPQQA